MADEQKPATTPQEPEDLGHVPMTEEFDRAKWTLPPLGVVAIALVLVAIIAGVAGWLTRPAPSVAGEITDVFGVATPDGKTLATLQVVVRNTAERGKPIFVKHITASVKAGGQEYADDAASGEDFERYFQAFPALKEHTTTPMRPETRVPAAMEAKGSIIVLFPVPLEQFNARESVSAHINLYDRKPLILKK